MSLNYHDREDETLIDYFRQMLEDKDEITQEIDNNVLSYQDEEKTVNLSQNEEEFVSSGKALDNKKDYPKVKSKDIDEKDDPKAYGLTLEKIENDYYPQPQFQHSVQSQVSTQVHEGVSLEKLLATMASTSTEIKTLTENSTESLETTLVDTNVLEKENTELKTLKKIETESQIKDKVDDKSYTANALGAKSFNKDNFDDLNWENISLPDEFQALFFLVQGVRFAVPLVDLGGIFEIEHLTALFGKPKWYLGLADIRGRKINVVDTLSWVKPDVHVQSEYQYGISLGDSSWAVGCNVLEGNRILSKDNVKWREKSGNRPWLAGIVKKEMCALLHIKALICMFENGIDLEDLKIS